MDKMYDLIILGAGPAGITAAIYAARKTIDFLVVSGDLGGQAAWSADIENYTGYQFITGPELTLKFQEHIDAFGIKVNMPETVEHISKEKKFVKVVTDKAQYSSKTAVIATGKSPRFLNIEGEKEFKNRGVTYCATCDGPLFKGKKVAIVGGGNSALDAALQMIKIASHVYIVNIASELTGDSVMVKKVRKAANVQIWNNSQIVRIWGDTFVNAIEVKKNEQLQKVGVQGLLIEAGLIPNSKFAAGI
ncbi:MAG: FAD-dependent oxidoreductase, partial [Candidatus Omnitrophota bacterium]